MQKINWVIKMKKTKKKHKIKKENKILNKLKKIISTLNTIDLNKIWSLMFFCCISWFFLICLLDAKYTFNPLIIIVALIICVILLTTIYKKLGKKLTNLSDKKTWIFYIIITVVMVILQGIIGYLVRTDPSWDLGIVIKSAQEMIQYGHSTNMAGYYIQAPNNILITLLIALTIKVFSFIGITNINIMTLIVNIVFIQLAIFLLFKITKNIYNNYTACFLLVIMFLFLPIYPYSTIMYTDTMSMFLPVGFLYLIQKLNDVTSNKRTTVISIVIGFLAFISLNLKVTALIVLIAFVINELINRRIQRIITIFLISICSFTIFQISFVTFIKKTNIIGLDYELTKSVPFTHFIMMGMYGSGAFDANEWQFTLQLPDYETRKEENIRVIKERLNQYRTQGYISFLNNKVKGQTWGSGTYDFESILNSYQVDDNIAHEFLLYDGEYYQYVYYYCQVFHFTMMFLIIISILYSIKHSEKKEILNIGRLSMFGLLLFLLMWETRSRYMLNYIPIYILITISGIIDLSKNTKAIKEILFYKN